MGGPGPQFEDFLDYCDFGGAPATKKDTNFDLKSQALTHFWQCCVFDVLGVLTFLIFYDFGSPEAPFSLSFWLPFGSPGPLKKQLKVCNYHQFQRFDPSRQRLFACPDDGCVLRVVF